jgi:hypothetical protein
MGINPDQNLLLRLKVMAMNNQIYIMIPPEVERAFKVSIFPFFPRCGFLCGNGATLFVNVSIV